MLTTSIRSIAVVLVLVLAVMAATPEKAHADPLATIGFVSAAVAVVLLVAYLVIANSDKRVADEQALAVATATPASGAQSP